MQRGQNQQPQPQQGLGRTRNPFRVITTAILIIVVSFWNISQSKQEVASYGEGITGGFEVKKEQTVISKKNHTVHRNETIIRGGTNITNTPVFNEPLDTTKTTTSDATSETKPQNSSPAIKKAPGGTVSKTNHSVRRNETIRASDTSMQALFREPLDNTAKTQTMAGSETTPKKTSPAIITLHPNNTKHDEKDPSTTNTIEKSNNETHLWLVSCDTREFNRTSPQPDSVIDHWWKSAIWFRNNSHNNDQTIHIVNICRQLPKWLGFMTKPLTVHRFLLQLLQNQPWNVPSIVLSHQNEDLTFITDEDSLKLLSSVEFTKASPAHWNNIVLFTDADTLFNSQAYGMKELLSRFDEIIEQEERIQQARRRIEKPLSKNNGIVISAEPACWVGRSCRQQIRKRLTPFNDTVPDQCPKYPNAGQYLGHAGSLLHMMTTIMAMNDTNGMFENVEYSDDQARFLDYYAVYLRNCYRVAAAAAAKSTTAMTAAFIDPEMPVVALDRWSRIFRSCLFGINKGDNYLQRFKPSRLKWNVSQQTGVWSMLPVVDSCPGDPHPFSIHGNGYSKRRLHQLTKEFEATMNKISSVG